MTREIAILKTGESCSLRAPEPRTFVSNGIQEIHDAYICF